MAPHLGPHKRVLVRMADILTKSLEDFVNLFARKYKRSKLFQNKVLNYLDIGKIQRLDLGVSKRFLKGRYQKKTDEIIRNYATLVYKDLKSDDVIEEKAEELQETADTKEEHEKKIAETKEAIEKTSKDLEESKVTYEQEKLQTEQGFTERIQKSESQRLEKRQEIAQKNDVEEIVKKTFKDHLQSTGLVSLNEAGELAFDERQMMDALEDSFLEEILNGINSKQSGFMRKLKRRYDGLINHFDEIEDPNQMAEANWTLSYINSVSRGYRYPTYPFIVVPKRSRLDKCYLDTALAIDSSGSMWDNHRWDAAVKVTLAMHSLMRKLNPNNKTYLAHYCYRLQALDTITFYKTIKPGGGTRTNEALEWLLETLDPHVPSLAILTTDGSPDDVDLAIKAAKRFKERPLTLLSMFLIDGNARTENITRKLGKAAGPDTTVIPVKNYELAAGVILNVPSMLKKMYNITNF